MRSALFLPPFDELADPVLVARLAAEAEEVGWDGLFVWDHIAYRAPVSAVADAWVVLSAIACATERLLLGPMVTPLPRRRPAVVARQTASLDRLSAGRLVLGVGTGGDGSRELSATGEELRDRARGDMLDEHLSILRAAWSGEPVQHRGEHYTVDDVTFLPTPVQPAGPPVWVGARYGNPRPLRRAAAHDGVFPIEVEEPAQLAEVVGAVQAQRLGRAVRRGHRPPTRRGPGAVGGRRGDLVARRVRHRGQPARPGPGRPARRSALQEPVTAPAGLVCDRGGQGLGRRTAKKHP